MEQKIEDGDMAFDEEEVARKLAPAVMLKHEAAIAYLVEQGRLVRLPGRVEHFVWSSQSLLYTTPVDDSLYPPMICSDCYESGAGPHWHECPRIALRA